jgi:spermidine synthase
MTAEEAQTRELIVKIIKGSHCFLTAYAEDEMIGMGRSISDRISDAYIQDVTVKKEYRHRGVGSKIIQSLVERLYADEMKWIGLIAERGTHEFYSRIGFEKMPNAMPMLRKM